LRILQKLLEEMVQNQLNNIVVELESVVEWQANTADEDSMGDQDDLPFDMYEELEALREG
jgi:hypothetical protein